MEIKVTFKFDASDSFLAAAGKFYEAAKVIAGGDLLSTLPDKNRGVVKAVATPEGVTVDKKERIYPPEDAPVGGGDRRDGGDSPKPGGGEPEPGGDAPRPTDGGGPSTPSPEPATVEVAARPLTEQDVRDAMHRTRQRIEGEDYKDNTGGELYQKYHRQLTGKFKEIASFLGSEKPSTLPPERRGDFIAECEALEVISDGVIGTQPPF